MTEKAETRTVVITGSTRGIGFGLAAQFLKRGHNVVLSGRCQDTVDNSVAALTANRYAGRCIGIACDVVDIAQVENLRRQGAKVFGRIDIWINNAGIINSYRLVGQLTDADIAPVIETNLSGVMNGTKVAAKAMMAQDADVRGLRGAIYNFEGVGSDGMTRAGVSVYGTTKRAITYFTAATAKELKGTGVIAGFLQPGIVVTELSLGDAWGRPAAEIKRAKKFVSMFGDPVEPVATFMTERILTNVKNGARINWLNLGKLLWRVLTAKVSKRDPIAEAGLQ